MKFIRKLSLLILIVLVFYALKIEPNLLFVRHKNLYLQNWNCRLDGFKLGVISDIHFGTKTVDLKKLEDIVNKINAEKPDLIVILGDLDAERILDSKVNPQKISNTLKKLESPNGVIAIIGNHDYKPSKVIKPIYRNAGITVLEDEKKYIFAKKQRIKIVGLKDLWLFKPNPSAIIGHIDKNTPVILLEHNPDIFPKVPSGVSLTLSGHTHGGEIAFPFLGSLTVPSKYGQSYRKGYVVENGKHLYVTSGIGTLSRMRFANPPEIAILKLYHQTSRTKINNTRKKTGFQKDYIPVYRNLISKFLK